MKPPLARLEWRADCRRPYVAAHAAWAAGPRAVAYQRVVEIPRQSQWRFAAADEIWALTVKLAAM